MNPRPLTSTAAVGRSSRPGSIAVLCLLVLGLSALGLFGVCACGDTSPATTGQTTQTTQATATRAATSERTWRRLPLSMEGASVSVNTLVMDPSDPAVLYAGTDEGLFKSTDGAASWAPLSLRGRVNMIAVDPGSPSTVYVTADWTLHRSPDGGATWRRIMDDSSYPDGFRRLWIDASTSPSTLYGQEGYGYGPFRSTDRGSTWEDVSNPEGRVGSLAIDPSAHALYATTDDPILVRSSDGGATWKDVAAGIPIPAATPESAIRAVVYDPRDPSRLYLYDLRYPEAPESAVVVSVFVSSDRARTWSEVTGSELDWAKAVLHAAPGTPAAAIEAAAELLTGFNATVTDVSGGTHTASGSGGPWDSVVIIDPDDAAVMYVPTGEGVYKSIDGGATWNQSMTGVIARRAGKVVVDPVIPSTIYATTEAGVAKSVDGGATWTTILEAGGGSLLALAPSSPSTLYVWSSRGLQRSDDGGATWARREGAGLLELGELIWPEPLAGLLVASDAPDTVYAIQDVYATAGLYRSTDGGNTWGTADGLPKGGMVSLVEAPGDPRTLYAGSDGAGVFKSTDGGETWAPAGDPSRGAVPEGRISLTVVPDDPPTIWALPDGSTVIWHSTNGGDTWARVVVNADEKILGVRVDTSASPSILYAATYTDNDEGAGYPTIAHPRIYRSVDGGETWGTFKHGFPAGWGSLVSDPAPDGALYVATKQGLYGWVAGAR